MSEYYYLAVFCFFHKNIRNCLFPFQVKGSYGVIMTLPPKTVTL